MAWSYSGDPASSDKDAVRFLIFDIDTNNQRLADEEINYLLAQENSYVLLAAARAAEQVAASVNVKAVVQVGDLKISSIDSVKFYTQKAAELRREAAVSGAKVFAGGRLISDKDSQEDNSDRVPPFAGKDILKPDGLTNTDDESRYGR